MKIGFIGCGNMATAMLKGILKSGEVAATDMIASAKSDKTRKKIEQELGIQKADTNAQVVDFAQMYLKSSLQLPDFASWSVADLQL